MPWHGADKRRSPFAPILPERVGKVKPAIWSCWFLVLVIPSHGVYAARGGGRSAGSFSAGLRPWRLKETFVVVPGLPLLQSGRSQPEVLGTVPAPKLLVIGLGGSARLCRSVVGADAECTDAGSSRL